MDDQLLKGLGRFEYDEIDAYNASLLLHGLESLSQLRCAKQGELTLSKHTSDAKTVGTLAHAAVLEPDRNLDEELIPSLLREGTTEHIIVPPEIRSRRGKAWEEFCEEHADKTILRQRDIDDAKERNKIAYKVRDAVFSHEFSSELLGRCKEYELTLICTDSGILCKGRADAVGPGLLVDLKTTAAIGNSAFGRQVGNFHYGERMALYRRWLRKITGDPIDEVWLIAVKNKDNFDVAPTRVPPEYLDQGEKRMLPVLQGLAWSIENERWPGICPQFRELHIHNWDMDDDEVELTA